MFRLFTARIKEIFDHKYIILVLDNNCFVFLKRALMTMFDNYGILY